MQELYTIYHNSNMVSIPTGFKENKIPFRPELKVGARIAAACADNRLIARAMPNGEILGFAPPLVISPGQVDELVDRARRAVDAVADALVSEGNWNPA